MSRAIQASCIAVGGRGLLIQGAPGSGKSSLALALIDRGAMLVGDDGVTVTANGPLLWASPPPNIAGLIEIRNVGLLTRPVSSPVPIALAVQLDPAAPRMPDIDRSASIAFLPAISWEEHGGAACRSP